MIDVNFCIRIISSFFVLQIIFLSGCKAQNKLDREEILQYWHNELIQKDTVDDLSIKLYKRFNQQTQKRIFRTLDSLSNIKVDSLCILGISEPGGLSSDSCFSGNYSIIYLLWFKNGKCFVNKSINNCDFGVKSIKSNGFFEFFASNVEAINKEMIMPVIIEAEYDNNKLVYKTETFFEDPEYLIYLRKGKVSTLYNFAGSYFTNTNSLFHEYNVKLKSYWLFNLIDSQVKDFCKYQ